MNNDQKYAIALGVLSTTLLWKPVMYPVLEFFSHSVSIGLFIVLLIYLFLLEMPLTALVLFGVSLYLLRQWSTYTKTPERKLYLDKEASDARFNSAYSIDLQFANKTVVHSPPSMLQPPFPHSEPLLTYPPSDATLMSLNG